eukprot:TRINITY_DN34148_c1_g1_i1.p1 TRINITY_DN34148_c1_g1~~TRINITY_DN34148_c1_g1_i1.p1  ORF type:complete len:100 (-),score=6.02 TRINITY_DN34148_c1_g1_i1:45-344(-)
MCDGSVFNKMTNHPNIQQQLDAKSLQDSSHLFNLFFLDDTQFCLIFQFINGVVSSPSNVSGKSLKEAFTSYFFKQAAASETDWKLQFRYLVNFKIAEKL